MSLSQRYDNKTLPDKHDGQSRLLVQVFGKELKNKLCKLKGFKAVTITPETAKLHGFTQGTTEVLLAPTNRAFYNCYFIDSIKLSKLIDVDLAAYSPDTDQW